jgi:hypothetical protein
MHPSKAIRIQEGLTTLFWNALSFLDPVVAAVFALKLPMNSTILGLLRLSDLTNIHTMTFRTDNRHSRNEPSDGIFLSLKPVFAHIKGSVLQIF